MNYIINGDSLQELKKLPDNSIDSVVTDPPYELGFMGKSWDNTGIANNVELWEQVLRVLKPGGHMLAFSGTRTYHRMVSAIEDAGFEIRDMINWTYGSGFPKNHDVAKAIDKKSGYEGKVIGTEIVDVGMQGGSMHANRETKLAEREIKELSPEAQKWQGFGTALKPSHEPIVLARKPVEGTIAENVLTYGTGAINIDGSRVGDEKIVINGQGNDNLFHGNFSGNIENNEREGRYPANTILAADEEITALFPTTAPTKPHGGDGEKLDTQNMGWGFKRMPSTLSDNGGSAARYFQQIEYDPIIYQAKASKKERNKGLDHLPDRPSEHNSGGIGRKVSVEKRLDKEGQNTPTMKNTHPTVKPIKLMEYLVKLITPPGGVVLDPFAGSGTTLIAAKTQGFNYIGIELTPEYVEIAEARLKSY